MFGLGMLVQALAMNVLGGDDSYVSRGAMLKCSQGTDPGVLNLPIDHGVYVHDPEKPLLNVADAICAPNGNISSEGAFGFCKVTGSLCKPVINFGTKWSNGQTNVLIDGEHALLTRSTLPCACQPVVTDEYVFYGGTTTASYTKVSKPSSDLSGGVITIETNGQD
ncbi:DUF4280 domain-containing protein [Paenibacillus wulumuqiensis]|uniref:DUF4280 domain-containing protein n=1 Tax=Paenibacillus wulumuqiensis TaxID=1567107 RepID=UPI000619D8B9|nr:DUF4280 domain-containing protein [Paenibacillus wulumuqiensis]